MKVVKGVAIAGAIILTGGAAIGVAVGAGAVVAGTAAYASLITAVSSLAMGAILSGVSAQLNSLKRSAGARVDVEYQGTLEPRRIIYGQVRVSGMHAIYPKPYGTKRELLPVVCVLAGHECNAIPTVYFGEEAVGTISSITGTANDGKVTTGTFANKAWVRRYLGTSSQTADYILNTAFTEWTSDHRGRGNTYLAVQYELDDKVYKTGRDQLSALVQGKKCYDPRLDTSPGANPTNASYIAYTVNPALCLADYLTDADIGMGEETSRIDWDMIVTAADICDETVAIPTASTQTRYTCNLSLLAAGPASGRTHEGNISTILACMMGSCLPSGGKWRITAGAWETPTFEITDSDVMGPLQIVTAYDFKERYNGIRGTFIDSANHYLPNEFPPVQDPSYVTDDGESVFKDIALDGCINVYEAQRSGVLLTRKSRNRIAISVPCSMRLWKVRPGRTGIVTITEMGWTAQQIRCEGWKFSPQGLVELILREESADDWDDPLEADYLEPLAISTPTPEFFTPDAPSGLVTVSTPRAVNLEWTAPALVPSSAQYVVYEYTASTPFASAVEVWRGKATNAKLNKSDTTTRYYWVRLEMPDGSLGTEHPTGAGVAGKADPLFETDTHNDAGPTTINGGPGGTGNGALTSFTFTPTWDGVAYINLNFTATCSGTGALAAVMPTVYIDINAVAAFSDNAMLVGEGVYAFSGQSALTGGVTYTIRLFAKVATLGADGNSITASNMRFIVNHQGY